MAPKRKSRRALESDDEDDDDSVVVVVDEDEEEKATIAEEDEIEVENELEELVPAPALKKTRLVDFLATSRPSSQEQQPGKSNTQGRLVFSQSTRGHGGGAVAGEPATVGQQQQQRPREQPRGGEGAGSSSRTVVLQGSWAERHLPKKSQDLAMSKKKIDEIRDWLQERVESHGHAGLGPASSARSGMLLVLSGPPGIGKSMGVRLLAQEQGFKVQEFVPGQLASWDETAFAKDVEGGESRRAGGGGVFVPSYSSRIDEFESFVTRISEYGSLQLVQGSATASRPLGQVLRKLTVIEDLPHVHGAEPLRTLRSLLHQMNRGASPVVLIMTDHGDAGDDKGSKALSRMGGLSKDVLMELREARATHISVPALTPTAVSKSLAGIVQTEGLVVDRETLKGIAEKCGGDMRNALQSLQLYSRRAARTRQPAKAPERRGPKPSGGNVQAVGTFTRSAGLGMLHGLAKFLYNKRDVPSTPEFELCQARYRPEFRRPPLGNNVESVIASSGLEGTEVLSFLHENYPDFIDNVTVALPDAMCALDVFSQAEILSSAWSPDTAENMSTAPEERDVSLRDSCAASVTARALCFYNQHPPLRREFRALRAPVLGHVYRALRLNKEELERVEEKALRRGGAMLPSTTFSSDLLPLAKLTSEGVLFQPSQWTTLSYTGKVETTNYGIRMGDDEEMDAQGEDPEDELIED